MAEADAGRDAAAPAHDRNMLLHSADALAEFGWLTWEARRAATRKHFARGGAGAAAAALEQPRSSGHAAAAAAPLQQPRYSSPPVAARCSSPATAAPL